MAWPKRWEPRGCGRSWIRSRDTAASSSSAPCRAASSGVAGRRRPTEDIALAQGHAQGAEDVELGLGLDPFRDQAGICRAGEVAQADDHCLARLIGVHI